MREVLILSEKREFLASSLLPKAMKIKEISVQENADPDPVAERMAAVVDLDRELDRQLAEMLRRNLEAHRIISQLEDARYRQLLELYYLTFRIDERGAKVLYTWETVAETMGYSTERVFDFFAELQDYLKVTVNYSKYS